jgi:hypothetical protein
VNPGRLRVAAGEAAAHHRLKGFVLQRRAAQIIGHPPTRIVGGLDGDAAGVLSLAIAMLLTPGLELGKGVSVRQFSSLKLMLINTSR